MAFMLAGLLAVAIAGAVTWFGGCSANDPFDPNSVPNTPPVVRLFVSTVDPDGELSPTSYYERSFTWSGSDRDGFVTEFYISIRLDQDVPAAWDTTTRTDTTMTFTTDENGEAEATFLLVCRDDRGALSDTLVQFVPLRNFPPVINFQSDFEPLVNMQREFIYEGEAVVDTVYWNWGAMNFRLFAFDLDGFATMDDYFRYTLADGDPDITWDHDDPAADPEVGWIRKSFEGFEEFREFEIDFNAVEPGANRTLTVSVKDEADADTRFTYSWEVRAPNGPVLYISDNSSSQARELYSQTLDSVYGVAGWDWYNLWYGFPDKEFVLLESLRKFDLVIWTDGGTTSEVLTRAARNGGVLMQYVVPLDDSAPGKLMMASRTVTGTATGLSLAFIQQTLGIGPDTLPLGETILPSGKSALGQQAHLLSMTSAFSGGLFAGLEPLSGTEALYKMEACTRCYSNRPPWDPVVGVRRPLRADDPLAQVVTFGLHLEFFDSVQAIDALTVVLTQELGVAAP